MVRKLKKAILFIVTAGIIAGSVSACGDDSGKESAGALQESEAAKKNSSSGKEKADAAWTSANGKVRMTLPDDTWKAETDTEKSIVLQSETGTINIVRYDGADMTGMMVPTTDADYQSMVSGGSGDTAVEVKEFKHEAGSEQTIYQGVMHYKNEENPYRYLIHYGIYDSEGGYTATGIVNSNDETTMETVKESVYSMSVAGDSGK